jgi:hypothetical protein
LELETLHFWPRVDESVSVQPTRKLKIREQKVNFNPFCAGPPECAACGTCNGNDDVRKTIRVHNAVNVLPHKGTMPATFDVVYMAVDGAGNEGEITREVLVEDIFKPILTPLSDVESIELEGGAGFDAAFATVRCSRVYVVINSC